MKDNVDESQVNQSYQDEYSVDSSSDDMKYESQMEQAKIEHRKSISDLNTIWKFLNNEALEKTMDNDERERLDQKLADENLISDIKMS